MGVKLGVGVREAVCDGVPVLDEVLVGVLDAVPVGVWLGVPVGVLEGVFEGVPVPVLEEVPVGVWLGVWVGVCVEVREGVFDGDGMGDAEHDIGCAVGLLVNLQSSPYLYANDVI
jgi:hypothetical protein